MQPILKFIFAAGFLIFLQENLLAADNIHVALQAPIRIDHAGSLKKIVMSQDGRFLAYTVGGEKTVGIISATDGLGVAELDNGDDKTDIQDIAISPGGKYLAILSVGGTARVWKILAQPELLRTREFDRGSQVIRFSNDDESIIVGRIQGSIVIWNLQTDATRSLRAGVSGNSLDPVFGLTFSADGNLLIWATHNLTVREFNMTSSEERTSSVLFAFEVDNWTPSPDGSLIAVAGPALELWKFSGGSDPAIMDGSSTDRLGKAFFFPDGNSVAVASAGRIEKWKVDDILNGNKAAIPNGVFDRPASNLLAISRDGRTLAVETSFETTYEIWRLN